MTTEEKMTILTSWCHNTSTGKTAEGNHYILMQTIYDGGLNRCTPVSNDWDKVVDAAYDIVWDTIAKYFYLPNGENSM